MHYMYCRHVHVCIMYNLYITFLTVGLIQCLVHTPLYAQCILQVDHVQPKGIFNISNIHIRQYLYYYTNNYYTTIDTNIASALKRVSL